MSDQTPTPRTAKAIQEYHQWAVRNLQATMRGSHLDSDDPKPPDGWATAIQLERELAAAISERDDARAEAAELRERLEAARRERDVAEAKARWLDGVRATKSATELSVKLPPDILMAPMPLPDRLDYAAKIIQHAFEQWISNAEYLSALSDVKSERDQLRERVERLRRALEYYAGAPWVAHHGPWHNANFADVADKALAETEPKGEA